MADERDRLRAADADREMVAERLRAALNEGRLTLTEYDDRVKVAYAARTYGDLKGLLDDLPDVTPASRSQVVPVPQPGQAPVAPVAVPSGHTRQWLAGVWSSWISVSAICVVIWIASGGHDNFWPIWVIGPWGAILAASTITGLLRGEPRRQAEKQAEQRAERRARRDAEREDRHQTDGPSRRDDDRREFF